MHKDALLCFCFYNAGLRILIETINHFKLKNLEGFLYQLNPTKMPSLLRLRGNSRKSKKRLIAHQFPYLESHFKNPI